MKIVNVDLNQTSLKDIKIGECFELGGCGVETVLYIKTNKWNLETTTCIDLSNGMWQDIPRNALVKSVECIVHKTVVKETL